MTIKAKLDKLHLEHAIMHTWVFSEGRMFVINETAGSRNKNDLLNQKNITELNASEKEKITIQ